MPMSGSRIAEAVRLKEMEEKWREVS